MAQLGDVLELVFGPAEPFRSLRATVRQWKRLDLAARAERQASRQVGRRRLAFDPVAREEQRLFERTLSVWIKPPSRFRVDERLIGSAGDELSVRVAAGDCWTIRDAEGHVASGQGDPSSAPSFTDVDRHFCFPLIREIFAELFLEACGPVRAASRDCIRARAVVRPRGSVWPHWLPTEADEYEFRADVERGVLLALMGKFQGEVFWASEALDVYFDEPIADEVFCYTRRPGEQVRAPVPFAERLTLEDAVRRMPFTVFVPAKTADFDAARPGCLYHAARAGRPWAHLHLAYHSRSGEGYAVIDQADREDPGRQEYEWEAVRRHGQDLCISDPGPGRGVRIVSLERGGTWVYVSSEWPPEQLIDLAASLVPAGSGRGN